MSLFSSFFQPKLVSLSKVALLCKAGCYLVFAYIILQSAFLMAASIEPNINVEQYNEAVLPLNSISAEYKHESTAILAQAFIQDECLDCNTKTCQCCSAHMFIFAPLTIDVHTFVLSFHRYQIIQTDMFYDLLLRPPKA
tara:strand:- start:161 stop:577 length:417 start_codon:yes stop_codon:yes gene_type:complete